MQSVDGGAARVQRRAPEPGAKKKAGAPEFRLAGAETSQVQHALRCEVAAVFGQPLELVARCILAEEVASGW